ncbi:MAG TPA: type II toxin-antitoxin system ParD family antitoxin [Caulobacteraceae bacterium]|jgi:putative addiction module CopG family antidote
MRTTRQISLTLPLKMADWVKGRVAAGEYASESEVVRDGLRALQERDAAVERWLQNEAVPTYEAYLADPTRVTPIEDVFSRIEARLKAREAKAG